MFKKIFSIAIIIFAAFVFPSPAKATTELIENFYSNILIQNNGSLLVNETINYNFGSNQKHGIYRDIPLASKNGPLLNISVIGVDDAAGNSYNYSGTVSNNIFHLKIGDANVLVTGVHQYHITYQVDNAIRNFPDHQELYWNATGDQWPVIIGHALIHVRNEKNTPSTQTACFTGINGSTAHICSTQTTPPQTAEFSLDQLLQPGEGFTIVYGLPAKTVSTTAAVSTQNYSNGTTGNKSTLWLIPLFFFAFFGIIGTFIKAAIRGFKAPKPTAVIPKALRGQPIVVEYNPPDKLLPIDVGTIFDRSIGPSDIGSIIIYLAIRGYLKIHYTEEKITFWPDKKDFEFTKLKDGTDLTHPAEKALFNYLFAGGQSVKLSDLQLQPLAAQVAVEKIKTETEKNLSTQGYYNPKDPHLNKKMFAIIICLLGIFTTFFTFGDTYLINTIYYPIIFCALVLFAIFFKKSISKEKLSPLGLTTFAKILGFKEFLSLTEKDKLEKLNAPELHPETFEKFLPYAMVLGVENEWAQKFAGLYMTAPTWYDGGQAGTFNSLMFVQNLTLFNSSFNQNFAASNSSGFSGGSSGGGSGGGGGGSW